MPLVSYDGFASHIKQEPVVVHTPLLILDKTRAVRSLAAIERSCSLSPPAGGAVHDAA